MGDYEVVRIDGKLTIRKTAAVIEREKKERREKRNAYYKEWYKRHRLEKQAKSRQYYHDNTEKVKAYQKQHRDKRRKEKENEQLRMATDSQH